MSLIVDKASRLGATDLETGARMLIKNTSQIEYNYVFFTISDVSLKFHIEIRRQFLDRPVVTDNPKNPCVMIPSLNLTQSFRTSTMYNLDYNTKIVRYMLNMMAFINENEKLANASFFWSDYEDKVTDQFLYQMPSNSELLQISLRGGLDGTRAPTQ